MDNYAKCHGFKLWACLLMTGSHIILATPEFPNGFSAPVVPLSLSLLSFFHLTTLKRIAPFICLSLTFFFVLFPVVVSLLFLFLSLSPIMKVSPLQPTTCPSPAYFLCFPPSVCVSPAWFSSNECGLQWGWPEVSWIEAERLMRIATLLFAWGVEREQMDEWGRERARGQGDRQTNWQRPTNAIMNSADAQMHSCQTVWPSAEVKKYAQEWWRTCVENKNNMFDFWFLFMCTAF